MGEIAMIPIKLLELNPLRPLLDESLSEGYSFMRTLWHEYQNGQNRFDTGGAILLGVYDDGCLIGIGGVQRDPYLNRPDVGRVRHVYVLNAYRRGGIGKRLIEALAQHARAHFDLLTLRTQTEAAAAFYQALGFASDPALAEATHCLSLKSTEPEPLSQEPIIPGSRAVPVQASSDRRGT